MPDSKAKISTYTLNCSFAKTTSEDNSMQNCFDLVLQEKKTQKAQGKTCDLFVKDEPNTKFTLTCKDRKDRGVFSMFWSPALWSGLKANPNASSNTEQEFRFRPDRGEEIIFLESRLGPYSIEKFNQRLPLEPTGPWAGTMTFELGKKK